MNEKLNIQDLMDMLAEKHGMSKENADSFVKGFFLLIEESLEKDKYVKIKGLGTFKLIDVDNRESVNVNTGERFEIQGHTKVSFTPEPTLKDIINRPFSHFETVVLNDNTVLEDTPLENGNENEDEQAIAIMPEGATLPEEEKFQELVDEAPDRDIVEIAQSLEEVLGNGQNQTDEVIASDSPQDKILTPDLPEPVQKVTSEASTIKYFIGIIIFVVLLCGGAIAFMYYPDLLDQLSSKPRVEEVADTKPNESIGKAVLTDTIIIHEKEAVATDTVAESLTVTSIPNKETPKENRLQSVPVKGQNNAATAQFKPDSVGYTIVGTETTYTIQEGETLTKVALRFYGTKTLWPYIVKHNPDIIKNPDNVPFGTTIKIPKLVKKQ